VFSAAPATRPHPHHDRDGGGAAEPTRPAGPRARMPRGKPVLTFLRDRRAARRLRLVDSNPGVRCPSRQVVEGIDNEWLRALVPEVVNFSGRLEEAGTSLRRDARSSSRSTRSRSSSRCRSTCRAPSMTTSRRLTEVVLPHRRARRQVGRHPSSTEPKSNRGGRRGPRRCSRPGPPP
jgi:hypothetical protein